MTGTIKIDLTEAERIETEDGVKVGQSIQMDIDVHNISRKEKALLLARFAQGLKLGNPYEASVLLLHGWQMCEDAEVNE